MSRMFNGALAVTAAVALTGCASSPWVSTWRAPDATPLETQGARVAAVVMIQDAATRRAAEDALEVPVTLLVLLQSEHRVLDAHVAQQDPSVEQIPQIVLHRDATRADEDGVLQVSNRERVDRESREEPAANLSDVHRALHATANLLLDERADLLAAGIGADADANGHGRHEDDREERDCADDDNEVTALHRARSPVRWKT